jgi:hypothetical protein
MDIIFLLFLFTLQLTSVLTARNNRGHCAARSYVPELDETRERVMKQAIADGTIPGHTEVQPTL